MRVGVTYEREKEKDVWICSFSPDKVKNIIDTAINRALIFAKLSLIGNYDLNEFNSFQEQALHKNKIMVSVPRTIKDKDAFSSSLENYHQYAINCSIRELFEGFDIFIEEVLLMYSALSRNIITKGEFEALVNDHYKRMNIISLKDKLKMFNDYNAEIPENERNTLISLKEIRHCIAHNLGVVTEKYFPRGKDGKARIMWKSLSFSIQGKKIKAPYRINEGDLIEVKIDEHIKKQDFNTYLAFTYNELQDITFFIIRAVEIIMADFYKNTKHCEYL